MQLASIGEIADQCLELQYARFDRHGVELRLHLNSDVPDFLCRATQIGQIVTNLLNNAFDAIVQSDSAERWISLATDYADGEIHMDVTDSGPGIEDHFKAHLMEPFFTTKEFGLGMGVGLSLSRAIAQDHGGTLSLCKDTEHTCFRLVLPIAPADRNKDHQVETAYQSE
jgi:C4-dicarboxylate-specific signal transduction histidine kinase